MKKNRKTKRKKMKRKRMERKKLKRKETKRKKMNRKKIKRKLRTRMMSMRQYSCPNSGKKVLLRRNLKRWNINEESPGSDGASYRGIYFHS